MAVAGVASAISRRVVVAVGLAAVFTTTAFVVQAQQAPAPAPAPPAQDPAPAPAPAPAAAPQDPFRFTSDAGGFLWQVKAEKVAEFEAAWKEIRTKLLGSDNADIKGLAESLRMYKIVGDPGPQGVSYLFVADPASKTLSYSPSPFLLFESKLFADPDARRLFDTLQTSSNGINPLSLSVVPAQ